jgi:hypothetical protein
LPFGAHSSGPRCFFSHSLPASCFLYTDTHLLTTLFFLLGCFVDVAHAFLHSVKVNRRLMNLDADSLAACFEL